MPEPATEAPPALPKLEVCPQCAYPLTGLPDEGICPECGRPYDQSSIVLYGFARGERLNLNEHNKRRGLFRDIASVAGWIVLAFVHYLIDEGRLSADTVLFIAIAGGSAISIVARDIAYHMANGPRFPGPVQVVLCPRGCVQRDRLGNDWIWPEAVVVFSMLLFAGFLIRQGGRTSTLVVLALIAAQSIRHVWPRLQRRCARPDMIFCGAVITPWKHIFEAKLGQLSNGSWHIQFRYTRNRRVWISTPVDAEVQCIEPQAAAIRTQVERWLTQSGNPGVKVTST